MASKVYSIMIAEDDSVIALELKEMLKIENYNVCCTVKTGQEAIDKAKSENPDLILMDINLSDDISGLEAIKKIKTFTDCPIIFTTAYSDKETINSVRNSLSDGYILKPYNYNELFTMINLVLKKCDYQKEIKLEEKKYHALFDNSKDSIFIIDKSGKFIDVNKSFLKMFNLEYKIIQTRNIKEFFNDISSAETLIKNLNDSASIDDMETEMSNGKMESISVILNVQKLDEELFNYPAYQGIIHDITEQKINELEIQITLAKLQNAIDGIIKVVTSTLEVRDPYTAGHQKRVAIIAEILAKEMGLPADVIEAIRISGEIHDIGKISVPAEILSKPGKLNEPEFMLIKLHPEIGYQILKDIIFPWDIAQIILQHHERVDGNGYPARKKGNEIRLEAKIISVADVFEAMGSHRPYRPSLGIQRAVDEIIIQKGIMFDTDVVDAFEAALKKGQLGEKLFEI
ncbi:MAG: response regulator [Spirochaetes bacterium]|nr:response regulator [Spirochaetota bacterium]